MTRRNLVVARVGMTSLHPRWLDRPYPRRTFDLLLSFYSAEAFAAFLPSEGVAAVLVPGGKFDGLFTTFAGVDLDRYDYVWLPDDDIDTNSETIDAIFALCRSHGLAVAQPSLTRDSFYSFFLLQRCPGFRLRYTNFVEVMVPCLRTDLLRRVMPLFEDHMSGWGLDYVWCRMPESGAGKCAILDAVSVHHTRPVGKVLKSVVVARGGRTPEEEQQRLFRRVGMVGAQGPVAFAGLRRCGIRVAGQGLMSLLMAASWMRDLYRFPDPRAAFKAIRHEYRRHRPQTFDTSPLTIDAPDLSPTDVSRP
ncbi:MAG: hypothetical protein ACK4U0_20335 [Mesorhizobium sp.]